MRKTRLISMMLFAGLLASSIAAWGQEKEASQKAPDVPQVRKVIQLKYADADNVAHLLTFFGGQIIPDRGMKVLTVSGPASAVEAVEEAVKTLDVPPPAKKDVEITAYFLLASRESSQAADLPPALKEVVAELRNVLNYQGFTLLNTALIRTQDDQGAHVTGVAGEGPLAADFGFGFNRLNVMAGEKGATIHIRELGFSIWTRETNGEKKTTTEKGTQERANMAQIQTNIDIPVDQKVVVGKTAFLSPRNALVLVLTAKVLD